MPHVVEDYYDMPVELLPSANFAGRPTSDIDMLAGLWATAASYSNFSSSEDKADENGHDDNNNNNNREDKASPQRRDGSRVSPPPPTEAESQEERPSTTTTLPPTDDIRMGSGVARGLAWARLRRKAHSAPYGSLESRASPLVEAVEAVGEGQVGGVGGLGYFDTIRRKNNNREKEGEQRRKKRVRSCDVEMSKRGMMGKLLLVDAQAQDSGAAISPSAKQSRTSLAQQTRVGPKRQGRQLAALDTDVAGYELSSRGCIRGGNTTTAATVVGSPSSVLSTPQELYAIGKGHVVSETLGSSRAWCARNDDPANIMVVADKLCSPSSPSNTRWGRNSITRTHTDTQHRRSSVDVAGDRIIYLPGTMMLVQEPVRLRSDSVATALDACTFDGTKLASEEKRYAELVGLEEDVAMFFEELGVVAEATEASLDRYWLCNGSCSVSKEGHDEKASTASVSVSVSEAESDKGQGSRASRFSFSSSASSCSAPVSSQRHRRKRSRLIELLLSPGMPGAVFANAPAS